MNLENLNYYNDHRVIAGLTARVIKRVTRHAVVVNLSAYERAVGEPLEGYASEGEAALDLPVKMIVCPCCDGKGSVTNPAIDSAGCFDDDEDFEAYMSGAYDLTCPTCEGANVTGTLDYERASTGDRALIKALEGAQETLDREARERAHELAWGY